jgi:tRNA/tmRNA/rRNA uracil-C5-methylase (TrmA/RlmC/RlmD family)
MAKNMKELAKQIEKLAAQSMQNSGNVKATVVKEGRNQVEETVYSVYNPKVYDRTGDLKEQWDYENTKDGIAVFNYREDDDTGKDIVQVVTSGIGYDYDFEYAGKPRDFIGATVNELEKGNELTNALKKDMKSSGLKVE